MKIICFSVLILIVGAAVQGVWADELLDVIKAVRQQIQVREQKVLILEHKRELEAATDAAKAEESLDVIIGSTGFVATSADTSFVFKLNSVLQVDNRTSFNGSHIKSTDGFILHRARPISSKSLYRDFDFVVEPFSRLQLAFQS